MRIASIDVGTNTILLLIVNVHPSGVFDVLHDEQVIARLGKGVDKQRMISTETMERVGKFIAAYKETCNNFAVDKIIASGTSALRDAKNRSEFCSFIERKTGISIEVVSGEDEAFWTYRGAISEFLDRSDNYSVIDIGGGSTEIITGDRTTIHSNVSIDIGSVRITERFFKSSPPGAYAIEEARNFIRSHIMSLRLDPVSSSYSIGVAGTVTTLAAIDQKLVEYDRKKVSGYLLTYKNIQSIFTMLKEMSNAEIQSIPQISPGRSDIILAGILILLEYMDIARLQTITVCDRGLRYGLVLKEIGK